MPVYNGQSTIKLALDSLLIQSYQNWSCVIVNDGSTDNTPDILESYSKQDKRFVIVNLNENNGRGNARQVALQNAAGDFLTYLDADDFFHPDKIKNQLQIMIDFPDIHLVSCGLGSFDSGNALKVVRGFKFQGSFHFVFKDKPKFIPVTSMLRLKEAQEVKYNSNLDGPEDTDYLTRYISGRNYYILNDLLYYYREFESLSYSKMINYTLNNLKRAYYLFSLSKMYSIKFFLNESVRLLAYILLYPIFGSNFIVQKRGQLPLDSQLTEFDNTKKALFSK
jgi:glycosyltransferase involved in cell wall biosynthesis